VYRWRYRNWHIMLATRRHVAHRSWCFHCLAFPFFILDYSLRFTSRSFMERKQLLLRIRWRAQHRSHSCNSEVAVARQSDCVCREYNELVSSAS